MFSASSAATAALTLVALASAPAADVLYVPGDAPNLEAALALASDGDEVVVQTSDDQNLSGQLTIDKAVTIFGDPVCNVSIGNWGMRLDGPESGELALVNVTIAYQSGDADGRRALFGSGFDMVRLVGCSIRHDNTSPTGLIVSSFPAVELDDVDQLTVVESDLLGGPAGADSCVPATFYTDGREGIVAPDTTVLLIDSTVAGGRGGAGIETTAEPCPSDLANSLFGGRGGDAVVAHEVHVWSSLVTGGAGVEWESYSSGACGVGPTVPCGKQPDGQRYIVSGELEENPCSRLSQNTTQVAIGETWALSWDPNAVTCFPTGEFCRGGCFAALFASANYPIDPIAAALGWVFLDGTRSRRLDIFAFERPYLANVPIPELPFLIGTPLSAQVLLSSGELSGPLVGVVGP